MSGKIAVACLVVAFCAVTKIEPWFQSWTGYASRQGNILQCLLGDSRRMLSNQMFVEADVYFHSGFYPSMFDEAASFRTTHVATDSGAEEGHNEGDETTFLGDSRDWIETLGRNFFPSSHTHLDVGGAEEKHVGQEREILPWLRASVAMDPQRVESYVVASFWLRERLNAVDEAEQFLREGLMVNPDSYELLYELGRSAWESRHNAERARHLWLTAIRRWHSTQDRAAEPDVFMLRSIYADLAHMEETEGNLEQARDCFAKAVEAGGQDLYAKSLERVEERLREEADGAAPPLP